MFEGEKRKLRKRFEGCSETHAYGGMHIKSWLLGLLDGEGWYWCSHDFKLWSAIATVASITAAFTAISNMFSYNFPHRNAICNLIPWV